MLFIKILLAVYIGVMLAFATMSVVCVSEWFINLSNKIAMKVIQNMEEKF